MTEDSHETSGSSVKGTAVWREPVSTQRSEKMGFAGSWPGPCRNAKHAFGTADGLPPDLPLLASPSLVGASYLARSICMTLHMTAITHTVIKPAQHRRECNASENPNPTLWSN